MKVVLQRVLKAKCIVNNEITGSIQKGLVLLVGMAHGDREETAFKMAMKVKDLRIFEDENEKMNLSLNDVGGEVLSISQFTLYADCKKGRRPSFQEAMRPEEANRLYQYFNQVLIEHGICVETGVFQADMKIELINNGPCTIVLDSKEL
ncbi:MAG: D-aminoacyl-tRNA deacylase [Erysipelotrichaceae bacterium]